MPELPEVETIVRGLRRAIVGKTIARASVYLKKIAVTPRGVSFEEALAGDAVLSVIRRGKYAVLRLASGRALVVGLRMTGRLVVLGRRQEKPAYTHVEILFTDGKRLAFADVRQFGRVRLVQPGEPWDAALGVEPLSKSFTPEAFIGMLSGRTTPVKVFLLDQRRIAGVGNIYAREAADGRGRSPIASSTRRGSAPCRRHARKQHRRLRRCARAERRLSKRAFGIRANGKELPQVRRFDRADRDRAAGNLVVPHVPKIISLAMK